ncbi:hypothetical protein ACFSUK_18940 [Sphingobium scionense]
MVYRFHAHQSCAILRFGKALQMQDVDQLDPTPEETFAPAPSPRAADWFWRPWYAKLTWALTLLYWVGLELMITIPFDQLNIYLVNIMMLLIFVFNPITVVAVLGYGFLKAKVACGEWVITPGPPSQRPILDPYTDPFDPRSGDMHLRHIGVIQD